MRNMRNLIIRNINELPKGFATGELSYYTMTNGFELHIRNNLAFNLQYSLKGYDVIREWKKADLSIHKDNKCRCLIELKSAKSCNILKKRNVNEIPILKSLYRQYRNLNGTKAAWYGVIFVSHPRNEIPLKYKSKVRNFSSTNKYARECFTQRQMRSKLKSIISHHFPESSFSVTTKTIDIGSFFETGIDLNWILITKNK